MTNYIDIKNFCQERNDGEKLSLTLDILQNYDVSILKKREIL